jgi:hypothetical protein
MTVVGAGALTHQCIGEVWCGFSCTRESARPLLADAMQRFYQSPFEPFERYSPYGTPEQVAAFLAPYIRAGCKNFNIIPCATDAEGAIEAVAQVRGLLNRIAAEAAAA